MISLYQTLYSYTYSSKSCIAINIEYLNSSAMYSLNVHPAPHPKNLQRTNLPYTGFPQTAVAHKLSQIALRLCVRLVYQSGNEFISVFNQILRRSFPSLCTVQRTHLRHYAHMYRYLNTFTSSLHL